MHVDTAGRHLKESVLWGNITWSEIEKQNVHANNCPM